MKKFGVRLGFGLALVVVLLLLVAVVVSIVVVENGTITRLAIGFLLIAILDLGLFANMLRRLPKATGENDEAGP
ncbi:MAG: hypothetical protein L0154_25770 [Chloroflexi bacterium]|nr:hypothetical protein [Chloroflexota bacterium]